MRTISFFLIANRFRQASGPTAAIIDVQIGEFLNIICPKYETNVQTFQTVEYHTLYMVCLSVCQQKNVSRIQLK